MTDHHRSKFRYDFLHDPSAVFGAAILVFFLLAALFAPLVAPHDPYDLTQVNMSDALKPPVWRAGGTTAFLLGADDRGRDILSTILFGCRTSLTVALGVVLLSGGFGVSLGLLAGYYGGKLDAVVMRLADTLFSFSTTLIAFLMLGLFKQRGVLMVIVAIAVVDWVRYARTMRGSVLEVKQEVYITAAKATGCSDVRILLKHLLPNALAPIFVVAAVDMAVVIMIEATLSFLGVGVPLTEPSLGMMIAIGKNYVYAGMWWMVLFPGGAMVLLVIGINLFADWLREELNPKISRRR
jgi:peptide/nickel transport system permease protein